ncbi:MAG: DUF2017 family protein [Actinomycetota bacterium]|nr:DUF2017 family protein [Actinomycetota bacterium]
MNPRRRVRRLSAGRYRVRLPMTERLLLMTLSTQLVTMLSSDKPSSDPSLRRLFPPAYVDDEHAERNYQELVRQDLLARRSRALDAVNHVTHSDQVDEETMESFLEALNALRLVIGTHLDVSENLDDITTQDDAQSPAMSAYAYLSWLEGQVVDAMAASLPPSLDSSP